YHPHKSQRTRPRRLYQKRQRHLFDRQRSPSFLGGLVPTPRHRGQPPRIQLQNGLPPHARSSSSAIVALRPRRGPHLPRIHHPMSRTRYLVSYDVCDPKRLRKVARSLEGFGVRLQYSVFECPLDDLRLAKLKAELQPLLNHDEDQVLF